MVTMPKDNSRQCKEKDSGREHRGSFPGVQLSCASDLEAVKKTAGFQKQRKEGQQQLRQAWR